MKNSKNPYGQLTLEELIDDHGSTKQDFLDNFERLANWTSEVSIDDVEVLILRHDLSLDETRWMNGRARDAINHGLSLQYSKTVIDSWESLKNWLEEHNKQVLADVFEKSLESEEELAYA